MPIILHRGGESPNKHCIHCVAPKKQGIKIAKT